MSKGFTLVELLVVIAVVGVLSGLVIVVLNPAHFRNQAQDSRRISNLAGIQTTLELSFADSGSYPDPPSGSSPPAGSPADPDGGSYTYCPYNSNMNYQLCATLEVVDPTTVTGCISGTEGACAGKNCCLTNPF